MSYLKTKRVQLGDNVTASNNFVLRQPDTADGTMRISNGIVGAETDLVTVTSAGNVGVGTSSPSGKLDVVGDIKTSGEYVINSGTTAKWTLGQSSDALYFYSVAAGLERMRIASNGMVQIGGVTNDSGGTKFKVGGSGNDGEITLHADTTASYITSYDRTAGAYHPIISTASEHQLNGGYVTMPNQPAFDVASSVGVAGNSYQTFNTTYLNVGSNFGNNRFTAPVAGVYQFFATTIKGSASDTDVVRVYLHVNGTVTRGSRHVRLSEGSTYGENGVGSWLLNLSASDYVQVYIGQNSSHSNVEYTYFNGYLVG